MNANAASVSSDTMQMIHKCKSIVGILFFETFYLLLGNQKSIW